MQHAQRSAGIESIDVTALEVEHSTFGCASVEEAITSLQEPQAWPPAVSPVETVYEGKFPACVHAVDGATSGDSLLSTVKGTIRCLNKARQRLSVRNTCYKREITGRIHFEDGGAALAGCAIQEAVAGLHQRAVWKDSVSVLQVERMQNPHHSSTWIELIYRAESAL